jgi:cytochrome o ubiquinol oxidase subunit IV
MVRITRRERFMGHSAAAKAGHRNGNPAIEAEMIWLGKQKPIVSQHRAIAQMGVHLVFFLHITTGPDNTNNVLALAFGVLIVILVIGGSLWIMANLNHNMMPMDQLMQMQR